MDQILLFSLIISNWHVAADDKVLFRVHTQIYVGSINVNGKNTAHADIRAKVNQYIWTEFPSENVEHFMQPTN